MVIEITREKSRQVIQELKKHNIDKDSSLGIFFMAQTSENADIILDYMKNHPEADQTEIMMLAYSLYKENNE